ncbi:hypothetical protein ACQKEX_15000 [Bacillus pumilus]|uniref:hypothetical protein n=1 Tax=Bacillus TaxID=1386 RepID=UPI0009695095|nr:hypothetical protein [Bacillus pumilus]MBU8576359.1 hypothetical protein [Bacillus pumilus]OLP64443.1 hypothetical protein BACPU_26680 [Bacillus pumilus]
MPTNSQHTVSNVHYDQYLTNISVGYNGDQKFIAEEVIPVVSVEKQSDKYMVFDYQDHLVEDKDIRRAPGSVASEMVTGFSDDSYFCSGYAKRYALYDELTANADQDRIFRLEEMAARQVKGQLLLSKEINAAALLTNPQKFHEELRQNVGDNPGTADIVKWSDYENSNPIMDVTKLRETQHRLGGPGANTLILSQPVYNILRMHPKLKSTLAGFTSPEFVSDEAIKHLFGVDNLIIGSARKANKNQRRAGEGGKTNYIWGNNAVLMYLPPAPGEDVPAAAYTFQWENEAANVVGNQKTRTYYSEESKTKWIESEEWYDQKITSKLSAVVLPDIVNPLIK